MDSVEEITRRFRRDFYKWFVYRSEDGEELFSGTREECDRFAEEYDGSCWVWAEQNEEPSYRILSQF